VSRHRRRPSRSATRVLGTGALAGAAALTGLAGTANAATPDIVPDLAPALTAPTGLDVAPAPKAPYVESSSTAFSDPINQGRDFAPAGVPITALIQSAVGAPTRLLPS
jgi:hypothetical protein